MSTGARVCWLCNGNQRLRPLWVRENDDISETQEAATQKNFCRMCVPSLATCQTCGDKVGSWTGSSGVPACHDPDKICQAVYWENKDTHWHNAGEHHCWIQTDEQLKEITAYYEALQKNDDDGDDDADSNDEVEDDNVNSNDDADDDRNAEFICAEPQCSRPITAAEAVTWHGDGEVYCLDCICDYHGAQ